MIYQETALLLQQIEAELKTLQLWSQEAPSNAALASTAPFACDSLTLAQWLQFIFLPRMQTLINERLPLPVSCNIGSMAEIAWAPLATEKHLLLTSLRQLDSLLSNATRSPLEPL